MYARLSPKWTLQDESIDDYPQSAAGEQRQNGTLFQFEDDKGSYREEYDGKVVVKTVFRDGDARRRDDADGTRANALYRHLHLLVVLHLFEEERCEERQAAGNEDDAERAQDARNGSAHQIAREGGRVDRDRSRGHLRDGDDVDVLVRREPAHGLDDFVFDKADSRVASAEAERTDLDEGQAHPKNEIHRSNLPSLPRRQPSCSSLRCRRQERSRPLRSRSGPG